MITRIDFTKLFKFYLRKLVNFEQIYQKMKLKNLFEKKNET